MIDPGEALQRAIYAVLIASPGLLAEFVGAPRVYDQVPTNARFPYITLGEAQVIEDGDDSDDGDDDACLFGSEIFTTLHVWDRDTADGVKGKTRVRRIAGLVREALRTPLTVEGQRVVLQQFRDHRTFDDGDGLTRHGVINHRFLLEPAA